MNELENIPSGLKALIKRAGSNPAAAPVEKWNPEFCGQLDMRIAADGTWYYLGSPIKRMALVRLFASVLHTDETGDTFLITPVEKIQITVEDAVFVAVEMHLERKNKAQTLRLRTNVGDVIVIGAEHPLRFAHEPQTGGLKPYVRVRGRLEALLNRAVTHELSQYFESVEKQEQSIIGIWSEGRFFEAGPA